VSFETFLHGFTEHVQSIIQWVLLTILILIGFLVTRTLLGKQEDTAGSGGGPGPSPELQAVLDKIMAQTAKLEGVSLQGMNPAGVAEVEKQVQALKKDLASREEEIGKLKAAGPSSAAADADKLGARIKELEARLAEYEILEDDIADLSLYKEENVRLKAELEKLKGGGAMPASAPAPAAAAQSEAIVAEFAQAVSQDPSPAAGPAPAAEAVKMSIPDTGNPMADFENTVQLERELSGAAAAAPAAPAPAPAPAAPIPIMKAAAAAPEPVASSAQAEADDLFAEFANPAAPDPAEASTLDTDKMMAEMAALVSMEPANGNALEEGIDMDKMVAESGKKG
jgi:hypothetical protein